MTARIQEKHLLRKIDDFFAYRWERVADIPRDDLIQYLDDVFIAYEALYKARDGK